MTLLTKAKYAALKGWNKSYLSQQSVVEKLTGALVPDPKNPKKTLVNVEKADEIFRVTNDPSKSRKENSAKTSANAGDDAEDKNYSAAKHDLTRINIEKGQIELAKLKGQLLNRQEVLDAFAKYGQSVRDQVLSMARPLSEVAATMSDAREIKSEFEKQAKIIFETVTNDLLRELAKSQGDDAAAN